MVKNQIIIHMHFCFVAGEDFLAPDSALSINISGPANQEICQAFKVVQDGRVESLERFSVELRTEDTAVALGSDEATVLLSDSDGIQK